MSCHLTVRQILFEWLVLLSHDDDDDVDDVRCLIAFAKREPRLVGRRASPALAPLAGQFDWGPLLVGRRASPAMAPLAGQLILETFLGGPTCLACKGLFERSRCVCMS